MLKELMSATTDVERVGKQTGYAVLSKLFQHPLWLALALLLFCLSGTYAQSRVVGIGPNNSYYTIHDFQDDFQVYDEATKAYVPYIIEQHAGQTALSLYVDLESNRHYSLLISTKQDGYLFFNAALKRKLYAGQWLVLRIDSLYRLYRQPEIFLTIYGEPGLDNKQVFVGYPKSSTQQPVILSDDNLSVRPRIQPPYQNFLGIGLIFLLGSHAFLFAIHYRAFLRFYSLKDLLSSKASDDSFLLNRPLSGVNLLFMLNLSFMIAYLIVFAQSLGLNVFASRELLMSEYRFGWVAGEFLFLSGISFIGLIGKYVLLEVIGGLYKLHEIVNIHFFKILQSSLLFFSALTLILTVIAYNVPMTKWASNVFLLPWAGFYIVRLVFMYFVIRSLESIKNLYLFSYLCIVELIPLIVGLRLAL